MEADRSPWLDLPLDIAGLVFSLLAQYADRAAFALVCPQWRAAASRKGLPPSLPVLALPDGTFFSIFYPKRYSFPGCGFAGYESVCGSWLVFPRDDGCVLVNPFSRDSFTLPALSSIRLRPPNAVAKWSLEDGSNVADPYVTWMHINTSEQLHLSKIMLCSPNLVAALVGIGHTSQILLCQRGASAWSVRAYDQCKAFEDMAFYQGKLYAIANDENLLVVNISQDHSTGDPQVSGIGQVIEGDSPPLYSVVFDDNTMLCKKLYLVESQGVLLMARRTIICRVPGPGAEPGEAVAGLTGFKVFKADFEHSRWVEVSTVGADQLLFLGRRCSRAMSVSQYDGLLGDYIFFLDDDEENRMDYCYDNEDTSFGGYGMRSNAVHFPHPYIFWKRCDEMRLAAWLFPQD
ncbi:hypothetical protein D1007_39108 [Hordeum vulgare]|nr:hypothetical protein D1007_39108 [Hordeum vulgare]